MHSTLRPSRHALLLLAAIGSIASAQTTIPAGNGRQTFNSPGSYILNSDATVTVTSGGNEVIRIADDNTSGDYAFTINGSVIQYASGRGVRTGNGGSGVNVDLFIGETGFVRGTGDDAIQGRNQGVFNLTNLGTLYSGNILTASPASYLDDLPTAPYAANGRGLNLRDAAGGGVIVNGSTTNSSALIRSDGGDAVRLGSNFTFTNYGVILGAGVVNDSSANNVFNPAPHNSIAETYSASDAFSFEDRDGATATNGLGASNSHLHNHGLISGARHGVEAGIGGSDLTVTNYAGGQIIGRNGSGVGFDTVTTDASKIVVHNYGLIRGDYAGVGNIIDRTGNASLYHDGDGDGIDIDGAATIINYASGEIRSTGAGGYDSGGRANNSEAISIGGGIIENHGLIVGANRGILVNNDSNTDGTRSGFIATTITNHVGATIEGENGYAIRLENKYGDTRDNDVIVNHGTIIGGGDIPDPDSIVRLQDGQPDNHSTGTLDGIVYAGEGFARFIRGDGSAIQMGEGDDILTNTGTIEGKNGRAVNLEGGNDTLNFDSGVIIGSIDGGAGVDTLNLGAGVSHSHAVLNFEHIKVAVGTATLSGVVGGDSYLVKEGAGILVLANANDYLGDTTVEEGVLRVENTHGSATGAGDVIVRSGARFGGPGRVAGNVLLSGGFTPGALIVGGDVTWNGSETDSWQFDFAAPDFVLIEGDFLKGTGVDFIFDFIGGGATGDFVLAEWNGDTDFNAGDFSFTNLAAGFDGEFSIVDNRLVFTAVPEPATGALLAGAAILGFALSRRRNARPHKA